MGEIALTKPILFNVVAFDSSFNQAFLFNSIGGTQVVKNKLIIKDNTTLATVYDQTQTTFKFEHIVPLNSLTNGTQYNAQIQTFDAQNNASPLSDPILFWCYTNATFEFTNAPIGNVVENSSYNFEVTYNQLQGELLNSYTYNLYAIGGSLPISTSGPQFPSVSTLPLLFSYLFTGFENGSSYSIECVGQTVQGTQISTGRISFNVIYTRPSAFTLMNLTNNCSGGYINIISNLVLINGISNPSPPNYIDDKEIDLRGLDWWVKWSEGYFVSGDVTMGLWGRDFNDNSQLVNFSTVDGDNILITYRKGYVDDDDTTPLKIYLELYAKNYDMSIPYYVYSNYIDVPTEYEQLFIYIQRIGDLYDLSVKNKGGIV